MQAPAASGPADNHHWVRAQGLNSGRPSALYSESKQLCFNTGTSSSGSLCRSEAAARVGAPGRNKPAVSPVPPQGKGQASLGPARLRFRLVEQGDWRPTSPHHVAKTRGRAAKGVSTRCGARYWRAVNGMAAWHLVTPSWCSFRRPSPANPPAAGNRTRSLGPVFPGGVSALGADMLLSPTAPHPPHVSVPRSCGRSAQRTVAKHAAERAGGKMPAQHQLIPQEMALTRRRTMMRVR